MTPSFIKGMPLCRSFFFKVAKPILDTHFPSLRYTAGLFGYGSDVLGYDDAVSSDHMWGPRFYLLLQEEDAAQKDLIFDTLAAHFPYTFEGFSVNFSAPDLNDGGVRSAEPRDSGLVHPLLFLHTVEEFTRGYLGKADPEHWQEHDWLACSEHRLLGFTSGELYVDHLNFAAHRKAASAYPDLVRYYLLASQWSLLGEEHAFVRRCGDVGDDLGSRLVTARMMEHLMRLCFLYCGRYAPYSKWFGTAFAALPIDPAIGDAIGEALAANYVKARERAQIRAQQLVVALHNKSGLTAPVSTQAHNYFDRKIQVLDIGDLVQGFTQKLVGSPLEDAPLIGTVSQVSSLTTLYENPRAQAAIEGLYRLNQPTPSAD